MCGGILVKKNRNLHCECGFVNFMNPRPTATGLLMRKNRLLLTKRSVAPLKGYWDLPGGFLNQGERAEDAILREIKEETGIDAVIKSFFGTYPETALSVLINLRF